MTKLVAKQNGRARTGYWNAAVTAGVNAEARKTIIPEVYHIAFYIASGKDCTTTNNSGWTVSFFTLYETGSGRGTRKLNTSALIHGGC